MEVERVAVATSLIERYDHLRKGLHRLCATHLPHHDDRDARVRYTCCHAAAGTLALGCNSGAVNLFEIGSGEEKLRYIKTLAFPDVIKASTPMALDDVPLETPVPSPLSLYRPSHCRT